MVASRGQHQYRREVEQAKNEIVRVHGLNPEFGQSIQRKIPEVRSDNDVRSAVDCGRQYVTIIRIWKVQTIDQVFEICNDRVGRVQIHEHPRSFQLFPRQVRAATQ